MFRKKGDKSAGTRNQSTVEATLPFNLKFVGSAKPMMTVGIGSYINGADVYCWNSQMSLSIGNYCAIADKITIILGGEHDKDWISSYQFVDLWNIPGFEMYKRSKSKGNVSIGSDVWIGNNVIILSGVTIGHGAVVGAGSLVTKNVEPYAVVGGNPARHLKYRFENDIRDNLLKIEWWNWPQDKIREKMIPFLMDPRRFVKEQMESVK